jgi:hypothetical protein
MLSSVKHLSSQNNIKWQLHSLTYINFHTDLLMSTMLLDSLMAEDLVKHSFEDT